MSVIVIGSGPVLGFSTQSSHSRILLFIATFSPRHWSNTTFLSVQISLGKIRYTTSCYGEDLLLEYHITDGRSGEAPSEQGSF
jgi:hypothetical protein